MKLYLKFTLSICTEIGRVYELPWAFMVCLHWCDWLLGEPTCAGFCTVPTTDSRAGDALIVPIRNVFLLPDQLKILPLFLCYSDSQVNYIKVREASFSSAPVSGVLAVQTNGWFSCRPRSLQMERGGVTLNLESWPVKCVFFFIKHWKHVHINIPYDLIKKKTWLLFKPPCCSWIWHLV